MVRYDRFDDLDPSLSTRIEIALEAKDDALLHTILAQVQVLDAHRRKREAINAYLQKQAATAARLAPLSLDALKSKFEQTCDYDEVWEIACAIADEIGEEAATSYFARVNALE